MHPKAIYESCPILPGKDEKKSGKKISKIVLGVKSRGNHSGKKWGLADIRKPDDGLGKKTTVLHYYTSVPYRQSKLDHLLHS